jgi:hypothetical protein
MKVTLNLKKQLKLGLFITILLFSIKTGAQNIDNKYLTKQWNASWITVPGASATSYGVYLFRKTVELKQIPTEFPVLVSADNRYKLFVNEKLVSTGPARGDVANWNFATIDLAPYLQAGKNIIAAQVWNEGELRPKANISLRTAFILQGGNAAAQVVNTGDSWKCTRDESYNAQPITNLPGSAYCAGSGEFVDMNKSIVNWNSTLCDDTQWSAPIKSSAGTPKNKVGFGDASGWMLTPSLLPQMEMKEDRILKCVNSVGIKVPTSFPAKPIPFTIPANTKVVLLLDQTYQTNAYSTMKFGKGKDAVITLGYAESLYESVKMPWVKGNRNEIKNKLFVGRTDSILSNGAENQEYTSLTWRTFRYVEIKISTQSEPLVINDIYGTFTGYPFQMNAKLITDNQEMNKMLEIGWRTARLCAMETYMDCPYYEQLQYIGDTRIQGLISLYNSGDDRLVKNALNQFEYSQQSDGITLSRYPSNVNQIITPFSLFYIGMVHDYMMYGKDAAFVQAKLTSVRRVLEYFHKFQQPDGSVKNLPWWNFSDWVSVDRWFLGVRVADQNGNSALVDFQLLMAYQAAADLEEYCGLKEQAVIYRNNAAKLQSTIKSKYWNAQKGVFADNADKELYSQHSNILAILTNTVEGEDAEMLGSKLLNDTTLAPASIYFKYYLHQALVKTGFGDKYLDWLGIWRKNMTMGLTTWAETSDVEKARSDCHAWGASPNIEFFRTVLGIDSDAPGFSKIKIEPHLGNLKNIAGEMPHPNGKIAVKYVKTKNKWSITIEIPAKITGRFIWQGKEFQLKEGINTFEL